MAAKELKNITGVLTGDVRVTIQQTTQQTIAEVARAGVPEGRYIWEEKPVAKDFSDTLKSSLWDEKPAAADRRAPLWQPAVMGTKGQQ